MFNGYLHLSWVGPDPVSRYLSLQIKTQRPIFNVGYTPTSDYNSDPDSKLVSMLSYSSTNTTDSNVELPDASSCCSIIRSSVLERSETLAVSTIDSYWKDMQQICKMNAPPSVNPNQSLIKAHKFCLPESLQLESKRSPKDWRVDYILHK